MGHGGGPFAGAECGLPGIDAFGAGEATCRAIGEQRDAYGFSGAFFNRLVAAVSVEVGGGVARVDGIHLDSRVLKLRREQDSEHVRSEEHTSELQSLAYL